MTAEATPGGVVGGVVLVGPRGAGKTEAGRRLAAHLGVPFVDADDEVERETGRSAGELLRDGALRPVEAGVLARLLSGGPVVLATGGGAVLWDGFAQAARRWTVVWLDAEPDELARRVAADGRDRPPLTDGPPEDEAAAVRSERAALYRAAASHRVDTTGRAPDEVCRILARLLSNRCDPEAPRAD